MNTLLFDTGGFPLQTEHLDFLQKSYKELGLAFGGLAGVDCILSGCAVTGSATADGYVSWNGEVYFFKGGTTSSYVILVEETEQEEYEDGNLKDTKVTRYITFGTGIGQKLWSGFKNFWTAIQNSTRRFVTDAEKLSWGNKITPSYSQMSFADKDGANGGSFRVQKTADYFMFNLRFRWNSAMRTIGYQLFTIPVGFRPYEPVFHYCYESGKGSTVLLINTDGVVSVYNIESNAVYPDGVARVAGVYY